MKDKEANRRENSPQQAAAESGVPGSGTESVTDLEPSSEKAADVQGGAFSPYSGGFRGGVNVAIGDVN